MPPPSDADQPKPFPITRSEFARRTGRARSSVSEACQGPLAAACLPSKLIDARHPAVIAWCTKAGIDPAALTALLPAATRTKPERTATASEPARVAKRTPDTNRNLPIEEIANLTVREVGARFGSVDGMIKWLVARKKSADIFDREFRTAQARGLLVPREFVKTHIFGAFEALNRRLLTDLATTGAAQLFNLAKSGSSLEDGKRALSALVSQQLKNTQADMDRRIREAGKNESDDKNHDRDGRGARVREAQEDHNPTSARGRDRKNVRAKGRRDG